MIFENRPSAGGSIYHPWDYRLAMRGIGASSLTTAIAAFDAQHDEAAVIASQQPLGSALTVISGDAEHAGASLEWQHALGAESTQDDDA